MYNVTVDLSGSITKEVKSDFGKLSDTMEVLNIKHVSPPKYFDVGQNDLQAYRIIRLYIYLR